MACMTRRGRNEDVRDLRAGRCPDNHDNVAREGFWRVPREGVDVGSIVCDSTRPEPVWG